MTDEDQNEPVEISFDDDPSKQATLLLAAAEDLDLDASEVRTIGGGFLVDRKIANKAGISWDHDDDDDDEGEEGKPKTAAHKRAAAKKATAKDEEKD